MSKQMIFNESQKHIERKALQDAMLDLGDDHFNIGVL
jgi:hypothetical protein